MSKPPLTALVISLLLAGCGSITAAGLIAASRLDPLKTPPEALSVAVSVPTQVRLEDGDAVMKLVFVPEEGGAHAPVRVSVPLTIRADGTAPAALALTDQVYVLQLDETSAAAFADAQQDIIALRAADVEGAGSLDIQVTGGCVMEAVPEVFAVATWLRSDPAGSWVQLTRRGDLFEVLPADEAAALRTALQPC